MSNSRKNPKSDLSKYYTIFWEFGLVIVLLIFIVAMKVDLRGGENNIDLTQEQEVVEMKEVVQTQQKKKPPPPPPPQVPVEVPNDEVVEQDFTINSELDLDEPLPEPPPQESQGDKEEDFFVAVEDQPELIGGLKGLQKQVKYPAKCSRANIEGRVTVQFVVNIDGSVQDAKVIRGIGGGCDEAAIEAVTKYAKFKPGRQRGKPVRVQMSLPILFRLQN